MGLAAQEALKQPTWCRLQPEQYQLLAARAHATAPENVLFTYKTHAAGAGRPGDQQSADDVIASSAAEDLNGGERISAVTVNGTMNGTASGDNSMAAAAIAPDAVRTGRSAKGPSGGLGSGASVQSSIETVAADAVGVSSSRR